MIGNEDRLLTEKVGSQKAWHRIRESQDLNSALGSATDPLCDLEQVSLSLSRSVYPLK